MAYPQSLGRWTETVFSSSVRRQCSVVWLLRSTRRNIGDDHLAAAIASLQRESIHPQVILFAEPRNTIGSLFDDAEVRSAIDRWAEELNNTYLHFFTKYFFSKLKVTMKRSFKIIFIFSLYTLMCSGVLIIAIRESTRQPIGLLVVSMALTPVLVAIFGGLPVNLLEKKSNINHDGISTMNEDT